MKTRLYTFVALACAFAIVNLAGPATAMDPQRAAGTTTVNPGVSMSRDTFSRNYPNLAYPMSAGACPPNMPLAQCIENAVATWCGMSPTCQLVLSVANYVIVLTYNLISKAIDLAFWAVDAVTGILYWVLDIAYDYVDWAAGLTWHLVAYAVALVVHLEQVAVAEAKYILDVAGDVVAWALAYAAAEIKAAAWLAEALAGIIIGEAQFQCRHVLGNGCPLVTVKHNFTWYAVATN